MLLGLAAGLALVLTAWSLLRHHEPGRFAARGGAESGVGAEVLCFGATSSTDPTVLSADGRCAAGSRIKLKAASFDARFQEVAAVAVGPGRRFEKSFRAALPSPAPVTLKDYLTLGEGERVEFVFVFSEKPLEEALLRRAFDRTTAGDGKLELGDGGGAIAERTIVIEAGGAR